MRVQTWDSLPQAKFCKSCLIWRGEVVPGPQRPDKLQQYGFKNSGFKLPKLRKLLIFSKFTPLSNFYKIWYGEGVPGPQPHAKFHCCGFENVGLWPKKSQKQ